MENIFIGQEFFGELYFSIFILMNIHFLLQLNINVILLRHFAVLTDASAGITTQIIGSEVFSF